MLDVKLLLQVNVDVESSYVLIPETGCFKPGETNLIVIDLGNLKVNSEKDPEAPKKYRVKIDAPSIAKSKPAASWFTECIYGC